jgi:hypothetical protein
VQLPQTPVAAQIKTAAASHSPLSIGLTPEVLGLRCTFHIY